MLHRLELPAADQVGIFVGLEVAHPHDDRLRPLRRGDLGDAPRQVVDEIARLGLVTPGQGRDLGADLVIAEILVVNEGHRVDLDVVADDELHPRETDSGGRETPPAEGGGWAA